MGEAARPARVLGHAPLTRAWITAAAVRAAHGSQRLGRGAFLLGVGACLVVIPVVDFNEPSHPWATAPLWALVTLLCAARLKAAGRPWLLAALPPALFVVCRYLELTLAARDFALIAEQGGPLTPLGLWLRNGWWIAQLALIVWIGFLRSPPPAGAAG